MTKKEFLKHFEECVNFLLDNNFPLPIDFINTEIHFMKSKSYFGICYHKRINGKLFHTIGINANFVQYGTEKAIINTIFHELIHTFPECQNHRKIWKSFAKQISEMKNLNICRLGGDKTEVDIKCLN